MKRALPRRLAAAMIFPLAVVAALILLLVSELSYQHSATAIDETSDVFDAKLDLRRLLGLMVDAESGQRGYLLTGKDSYLTPYTNAARDVGEVRERLAAYYRRRPLQQAEFQALDHAIDRKLSELALTVQLRREGRDVAWEGVLEADIGKEAQDSIRLLSARLETAEAMRLKTHQDQVNATLLISRIAIAAMTVLSLLAFYFYLRQSRQLVDQRERQRLALQRERDSLDAEVQRRTRQLTVLAQHLQTMREDERSHLARELHDELGALLTSAKLDVARLKSRLPSSTPEVQERLAHLNELLNSGIALKRRIIEDLRPSSLRHLGLVVSLDNLLRDFQQRSGIAVDAELTQVKLNDNAELTIYRFVQEALTNITKYAHARHVTVRLRQIGSDAEIAVSDDGAGFDPAAVRSSAQGLVGMRYRVEALGGRMQLHAQAGAGVQLSARLPHVVQGPAQPLDLPPPWRPQADDVPPPEADVAVHGHRPEGRASTSRRARAALRAVLRPHPLRDDMPR